MITCLASESSELSVGLVRQTKIQAIIYENQGILSILFEALT